MDRRLIPSLVIVSLTLAACGNNKTPPFTGAFRVVNGITDSSTLDASIANVQTDSQNIQLDTASEIADILEGSYDAQLTPSDSSKKFSVDNVNIDHNNVTTILTYGTLAGGTQGGFTAEESLDAPTNGQAVLQPVNAAYAATVPQALDILLSFTGVGGTTNTQNFGASFGESAPSYALAGGTYEISVSLTPTCVPGDGCPAIITGPVFDSGSKGINLPFSNGANVFQIIAVDATSEQKTTYGSNIVLLLIDNQGNSTRLYNGQN